MSCADDYDDAEPEPGEREERELDTEPRVSFASGFHEQHARTRTRDLGQGISSTAMLNKVIMGSGDAVRTARIPCPQQEYDCRPNYPIYSTRFLGQNHERCSRQWTRGLLPRYCRSINSS